MITFLALYWSPFSSVEVAKAAREGVSVKPVGVHFRPPLDSSWYIYIYERIRLGQVMDIRGRCLITVAIIYPLSTCRNHGFQIFNNGYER